MSKENETQSEHSPVFASKKQALTILIVLFILLGVGIIAYQSGQRVQSTSKADESDTLVPTKPAKNNLSPQPKTTSYVQITKSWPEYTDPKQTFQIKYPNDWVYQNTCSAFKQFRNSICLYSRDFRFSVEKNKKVTSPQQAESGELVVVRPFDEKQYVAYNKEIFCSPGGSVVITNCHEEVLRGEKVAIREVGSPTVEENIWIIRDETVVMQVSRFVASSVSDPVSPIMMSTLTLQSPQEIPADPANTKGSCIRAGCSGELCVDSLIQQEGGGIETACVFKDEYTCLQKAICERQADGTCDFTDTEESLQCTADLTRTPGE